jgi:hypothetical protein
VHNAVHDALEIGRAQSYAMHMAMIDRISPLRSAPSSSQVKSQFCRLKTQRLSSRSRRLWLDGDAALAGSSANAGAAKDHRHDGKKRPTPRGFFPIHGFWGSRLGALHVR